MPTARTILRNGTLLPKNLAYQLLENSFGSEDHRGDTEAERDLSG
jgi:hypothetical protein